MECCVVLFIDDDKDNGTKITRSIVQQRAFFLTTNAGRIKPRPAVFLSFFLSIWQPCPTDQIYRHVVPRHQLLLPCPRPHTHTNTHRLPCLKCTLKQEHRIWYKPSDSKRRHADVSVSCWLSWSSWEWPWPLSWGSH